MPPAAAPVPRARSRPSAAGGKVTGTILFQLYREPNCQGATNLITSASVDGDGSYTSLPIAVPETGVFHWVATYSGDNNNLGVVSAFPTSLACNADPVEIENP
jgi:hypothetical protein